MSAAIPCLRFHFCLIPAERASGSAQRTQGRRDARSLSKDILQHHYTILNPTALNLIGIERPQRLADAQTSYLRRLQQNAPGACGCDIHRGSRSKRRPRWRSTVRPALALFVKLAADGSACYPWRTREPLKCRALAGTTNLRHWFGCCWEGAGRRPSCTM